MFKISKRDNKVLEQKAIEDIKSIRRALKKEPIVIKTFKKYKLNPEEEINNMSINFVSDLDVSAKTINGKVYLNSNMLEDNWKDYFHYLIHEGCHVAQHHSNTCKHNKITNENYLDNESEIEAFQAQLKYREKTEDKSEIDKYLTDLFNKHQVPQKDRPDKKKELLDK